MPRNGAYFVLGAVVLAFASPGWAQITTSVTNVSVVEGGTTFFEVRLSSAPAGTQVVTVFHNTPNVYTYDTNVSVLSGSSLTFTSGNWNAWQTVVVAASSPDPYASNGTATITCASPGLSSVNVTVREVAKVSISAPLYVAATGDDTAGDGSSGNPYRTIQKAVWVCNDAAGSSNLVYVSAGTYNGFRNETSAAATPIKYVYVKSWDGTSAGANWKNTVINADKTGSTTDTPYICTMSGTGATNSYGAPAMWVEGFTVVGPGSASNASEGIRNGSFQGTGWLPEFTVRNCVVKNFAGGNGINANYRAMVVENCLVYGNMYGIRIADGSSGYPRRLFNCTVTGNAVGMYLSTSDNAEAYNSIIYGNSSYDIQCFNSNTSEVCRLYNCDVGSTTGAMTWLTRNNINIAPQFTGGSGDDQYKLAGGSPCLDVGSNSYRMTGSSPNDLWQSARIINGTIDIGACERSFASAPTVYITSPVDGAAFDSGTAITIAADAMDDGSVTRVEFYRASTCLGTATSAPYQYAWNNAGAGTYALTARAYDNSGNSRTSAAVNIAVKDVSIAFSPDEKFVTIDYRGGRYAFRRPVTPSWKYTPASGKTWWVDPNGRDANPGTQAQPFKTLQMAANSVHPGDLVNINAGTYTSGFKVTTGGTAGAPIIFSCSPGALGKVWIRPPVSWFNVPAWTYPHIVTVSAQNVTVNGLILYGYARDGNLPAGAFDMYHGCGIAYGASGAGGTFTNNIALYSGHCGLKSVSGGANFWAGNIAFENGIDFHDHGMYMTGDNEVVDGNIVFKAIGYGIHAYGGHWSQTLRRNLCIANGAAGMLLQGFNAQVYNNDCTDNLVNGFELYSGGAQPYGNVIQNNIFAFNTNNFTWGQSTPSANTLDYNCYYTGGPGSAGSHSITVDPQFLNRLSGDLLIAKASPCVNAGVNVGLPFSGSAPDMGAFEADQPVVMGRYIFYNNSRFDGNDPAANAADDGAIAPDKYPLYPNHPAVFANYTSYSRGINGIMVDIANLPAGTPTAADFTFKVGNDNNSAAWAAAPSPGSITVRRGAGAYGSDRVTIIWSDNAIQKQWLQVTVKGNTHTGLPADDVFYWGNAIGETGNSTSDAMVTPADEIGCRNNPHTLLNNPAAITDPYDFNRDGKVGPTDEIIARNNATNSTSALKLITVP